MRLFPSSCRCLAPIVPLFRPLWPPGGPPGRVGNGLMATPCNIYLPTYLSRELWPATCVWAAALPVNRQRSCPSVKLTSFAPPPWAPACCCSAALTCFPYRLLGRTGRASQISRGPAVLPALLLQRPWCISSWTALRIRRPDRSCATVYSSCWALRRTSVGRPGRRWLVP